MSNTIEAKGSCLCGKVQIAAKQVSTQVWACHCNMCRKWAGGPLLAVDCGTDVSFIGEENISLFSSSEWAERGFCSHCGSHLFYRLKHNHQYNIEVGLFDNQNAFTFDYQIFIDEKPELYHFGNQTKNLTGAEVFAQFSLQPA